MLLRLLLLRLGLTIALVLTLQTLNAINGAAIDVLTTPNGMVSVTIDPFSQLFKVIFLVATLLAVFMSFKHLDLEDAFTGRAVGSGFFATMLWGIRRGLPHMIAHPGDLLYCDHLEHISLDELHPYLCVPIMAQGEMLESQEDMRIGS